MSFGANEAHVALPSSHSRPPMVRRSLLVSKVDVAPKRERPVMLKLSISRPGRTLRHSLSEGS